MYCCFDFLGGFGFEVKHGLEISLFENRAVQKLAKRSFKIARNAEFIYGSGDVEELGGEGFVFLWNSLCSSVLINGDTSNLILGLFRSIIAPVRANDH